MGSNQPDTQHSFSSSLLGGGNVPASGGTQVPNNNNLSSQYAEAPSAYGFTSTDYNLPVGVGRVADPDVVVTPGGKANRPDGSEFTSPSVTKPSGTTHIVNRSMADYMTDQEKKSPADIAALQQELYDAGLYDSSFYTQNGMPHITGVADEAFKNALHKAAVESASSQGNYTVDEIIQAHKTAVDAAGGLGGTQKKLHLTNPEDVAANAAQASYKITGRALDPDTLAKLQANAESAAQQSLTASQGENVSAFTPSSAWLEQQVQQLAPQASQNFSTFENFQAAQQLFGSPTSPVGNLYHA